MKKTALPCLLLALLAAAGTALTACGEASAPVEQTKNTAPAETETVPETEDTYLHDNLPDGLDFGGTEIVIHTRGDETSAKEVSAEADGEVLDDAIYARNQSVEERLNVKIVPFLGSGWQNYSSDVTKLRSTIQAGDNTYQIVSGWKCQIPALAPQGCFHNLLDVEYLDITQPWWNQPAVQGMRLHNCLHFVTGDLSILTVLGCAQVMFVNDAIASNYDLESIPDVIRAGNWTLDYMISTVKKVEDDLNGDSVMDKNDRFGAVLDRYNSADAFYVSCDIHQIEFDKDGNPFFAPAVERTSNMMDKLHLMYNFGAGTGTLVLEDMDLQQTMFANGQALITNRELDAARSRFRDMDDSYTIIPFPKLDDAQADYRVDASNSAQIWGIPVSNPAPEVSAAVMEAMACESHNKVIDVFYETCMQNKYARNEDTIEMLNLIRDKIYLDAELMYSTLFDSPNYVAREQVTAKTNNVASWIAKKEKSIAKTIDKLISQLDNLD